ncbi:hypothetical protein, partial [Collinsella sp. Sow4_E3]|uniref:hypothetical protein n=1 Tax=Collinsella sp. Sow4_E3 TaxID=3438776 RepID=UPI003F913DA2
ELCAGDVRGGEVVAWVRGVVAVSGAPVPVFGSPCCDGARSAFPLGVGAGEVGGRFAAMVGAVGCGFTCQ